MGKKGDLLRQQKKLQAKYVFTAQQLEEHDQLVRQEYKKNLEVKVREYCDEADKRREERYKQMATEFWDRRAAEFKDCSIDEQFNNYFKYGLALVARTLIEQFGWPVPNAKGRKNRTRRFIEALIEGLNAISADVNSDIIWYTEETEKLYGISIDTEGENNNG